MASYSIVEPHPTPATHAIHVGRGGSGNIACIPSRETALTYGPNASGPASKATLTPPPSDAVFLSGRGGAGNAHREHERAIFSFDEELKAQRRLMEGAAPVYHVGRGGAGNAVDERTMGSSLGRSGSTSSASDASGPTGSKKAKRSLEEAWNRVSKTFSRQ